MRGQDMRKIAVIVIDGTTREFDREYHYLVPDGQSDVVEAGMRAIVPFGKGNSLKEGYIVGFVESSDFTGLKEIKKLIDKKPVLIPPLIDLAVWMRQRYFCTYSQAIKCMLPAGIGVKSLRMAALTGAYRDEDTLTPNQKFIVDLLASNEGCMEHDELKKLYGRKSNFGRNLADLADKGIIAVTEQYETGVREKTVRAAGLAMPAEEVAADIDSGVIKRIQQIRVLEMLLENEYIAAADLARFAGVTPSVLDTLRKYGYIYYRDIEIKRDPVKHREIIHTEPMTPTPEQKAVLDKAMACIDSNEFSEMLLHGVTGSGKTEVYLQLIQYVLEKGRQAIVLVPEISLTPQMVDRFRGRFGNMVAVMHSRLSPGERYDQWRLIRDGSVRIAVGARSAIFAPFRDLGLVIIDEEHENTYKSETTPKYTAAEVAARRCMHDGALLMYGSATPSIETYQRALEGRMSLAVMKERANTMVMPEVRVVDMRMELDAGNRTIFSSALSSEIEKNLACGQQTILFLNKRGYASFVLCRNCGIRLKCRYCNITMTYHSVDDRLICHYCGYTAKMPSVCPKCGSGHIRQFGTGTQKVEEELHKYFPSASVIRMDMDTTTGRRSHEEILDAFRDKGIDILIGTQMIAKGHDFPNVTLVGVLAADSLLGIDDYRASERTFQLLTQVAGRAGRGQLAGRVVIQTYNTEDYSITASCRHDYEAFFMQESRIRKRLNYPPFTNIAVALVSSVYDRLAYSKAGEVHAFLASRLDRQAGDELLPGPVRAPISRMRNRYRWRVAAKCSSVDRLCRVLADMSDHFAGNRGNSDADLSLDINPSSML
jgi:primosomal protein N' (replication factor Y)